MGKEQGGVLVWTVILSIQNGARFRVMDVDKEPTLVS